MKTEKEKREKREKNEQGNLEMNNARRRHRRRWRWGQRMTETEYVIKCAKKRAAPNCGIRK